MCVYEMGNGMRLIDLSKPVDPATEDRRCKLERFYFNGPVPDYVTNMDLMSHLGTHAECPYHHNDNWSDASQVPLSTFVGRAVYICFDEAGPRDYVTPELLEKHGGKLRPGDIVVIDSPYRIPPFTDLSRTEADQRMLVCAEAAQWFLDHGIKCIAIGDGVSVETSPKDVLDFHQVLMKEDGVFLEVLRNLDKLQSDVFFLSCAPLPIKGLDSSPVRAYAIEGLPGFTD